jgi:hypothetical protein
MSRGNIKAAARYETLKAELTRLGLVRPGSLVERYMPCGKPGCRCMGDPPVLHGPYYQWTHKIRSKTITMRLSKSQADRCKDWIRNHRQMKTLVRRMETLSLKETNRILRTISHS